jgi:hypothetical protein
MAKLPGVAQRLSMPPKPPGVNETTLFPVELNIDYLDPLKVDVNDMNVWTLELMMSLSLRWKDPRLMQSPCRDALPHMLSLKHVRRTPCGSTPPHNCGLDAQTGAVDLTCWLLVWCALHRVRLSRSG